MTDMNTAMTAVKGEIETTVHTRGAYFDLKEYIAHVKSPEIAAQMAQSVAFIVDVQMAKILRQIMKEIRAHHEAYGYDSIGAMTDALADQQFADEVMREHGVSEAGLIEQFTLANLVRADWHLLAQELTGMTHTWQGVPRTYEWGEFDEFLAREIKLDVKPAVERRIRLAVERRADSASKEDVEAVIARRVQREGQKLKDVSRTLADQTATLITLYDLLDQNGHTYIGRDPYDNVEFYDLSTELRQQLIEAALRGAARAEDFATNSSSITDAEFDQISFGVIKVERELKTILAGPAYAVQRAMATV